MAPIDPHWLEYRRKYFIRPNGNIKPRANAHLSIRHDAYRFMPPGSPRYVGKEVVRYFWDDPAKSQTPAVSEDKAERMIAAELDWLRGLKREAEAIKVELRILRRLRERKYSADQPRVPAGSREGGQWASGTGSSVSRNDSSIISDATPDGVRPGTRYAEARRPGGYPLDLREEERLGGHSIQEHVGKSDAYLRTRVREEAAKIIERGEDFRGLSVGSFTSVDSANRLVNSAVSQSENVVDKVAHGEQPDAFLTARFGSPTGSEAYLPTFRAQPYMRETYGVGVFILRDPRADKGWRVQSAYPLR